MENIFFTLQEFMLHAKSTIYILMGVSLVGIAGFWRFLSAKDD
jgi:hypothetical protein